MSRPRNIGYQRSDQHPPGDEEEQRPHHGDREWRNEEREEQAREYDAEGYGTGGDARHAREGRG